MINDAELTEARAWATTIEPPRELQPPPRQRLLALCQPPEERMTAHELARILLAGPDLPVELETENDIEDLAKTRSLGDRVILLGTDTDAVIANPQRNA